MADTKETIYLIHKDNYRLLNDYLSGIVFRQDHSENFNRIKFFAPKFERQVKEQLKDKFDLIFQLEQ